MRDEVFCAALTHGSQRVVSGNPSFANRNQSSQLTAMANLSSGSPQDVTSTATWSSSNGSVASVSPAGLLTALGNGNANISASYQGQAGVLGVVVAMKATPQVSGQFYRLCSPFRARMDVTMTEASTNIGMDVTSVTVTMRDIGGVVRHTRTFSAAAITAMVGSNHINAGQSRAFSDESAYPGGVDTGDSTVIVTFQHDGC